MPPARPAAPGRKRVGLAQPPPGPVSAAPRRRDACTHLVVACAHTHKRTRAHTLAAPALQAYLSVAPHVASFPEYFEPLAWHLLRTKARHWERGLRELSAQALAGEGRQLAAGARTVPSTHPHLADRSFTGLVP